MPNPDLSVSPRAIWRLTWPQMLMMGIMFITGICTVWAAGQISPETQASLGLATQCSMFLMVVIMAISSGATAAITQSMGMGRVMRAKMYIVTTMWGSFGLGIIMAVPAWIYCDAILRVIQVPEAIFPMCREIWGVALLGLPLQYVYMCSGVMFRATRLVIPPLWVAALVCVSNLVFGLGFGLGYYGLPDCGYMGLIWTNVGTQALGAIANCFLLWKSGYFNPTRLPDMAWLKKAAPYLIRVALPAGAAQIVWQSGYLTLFALVASLPHDSVSAVAGLTAGLRAESILFMPGMAFNMTCSIIVGNSLGENKPEQARRAGLLITLAASMGMSLMALCFWPFRADVAALLSQDEATKAQIVNYLSYNLAGTPFSIASTVMGGIMVGAGATQYNLLVYGGTFWALRLPLGWLLGHRLWDSASGVFAAMFISQFVQTCLMLYVVIRVNWMRFAMKRNFAKSAP